MQHMDIGREGGRALVWQTKEGSGINDSGKLHTLKIARKTVRKGIVNNNNIIRMVFVSNL